MITVTKEYEDIGLPMMDPKKVMNQLYEVRMYSDRLDNKSGVSIKTCNRLKGVKDMPTGFKHFVEDSGFTSMYKYRKFGYYFHYDLS